MYGDGILPKHLQLGISIAGMESFVNDLPPDAVKQCNDEIPVKKDTHPPELKFPANTSLNGYVNQFHITKFAQRHETPGIHLSVCEVLKSQGSTEVGPANEFVSWFLDTDLMVLLDALKCYVRQNKMPLSTKFWVCDFVIHQNDVGPDLKYLGECVAACERTVLLMVPWY